MTTVSGPMQATSSLRIDSPQQLREVMDAEFTFSDQQFAAITSPLEPAVVVAGAGSGKTAVMAARVVYLVATGQVAPHEVLGLTFTTKAAGELGRRVRGVLAAAGRAGDDVLEPTVSTYHAYAASLLTEHGLRIGHEPDTRVIADASRYQLAERAVARYEGRVALLSEHLPTVVGWILALDAQLSEHLCTPERLRAFDARQRDAFAAARDAETTTGRKDVDKAIDAIDRRAELLGLVAAYRRLEADLGLMDFGDQIALAADLAERRPEVGQAQRDAFKVVLLDEYQDTSVAQAHLLGRLFSGPSPERGRGHPVTAVGDPNQAIYGWRGASVSNIVHFEQDFPAADGGDVRRYSLSVNRRSDDRILKVANRLATPLYAASPGVQPLRPKEHALPGAVRAACFETYPEELAFLAREVRAVHVAGQAWSGIGVLTRDNAHAADVYDALTGAEIPVEIVGLAGLLRLPEVAEVVATLELLHDLTANAALLTLLTGPRWDIGPRDLALLGRRAAELGRGPADSWGWREPLGEPREREPEPSVEQQLQDAVRGGDPVDVASLSDALDDPGPAGYSEEARERFALLSHELRGLRALAGEPLLDLVRRIIDTTGIDLELDSATNPAAAARRDNLDLFVQAVARFQAVDGDVSLGALLAYLQAEDEFGNGLDAATPTAADSVKLLTMHRAKGLEWDVVFVAGVCETKLPSTRGRLLWTTSPAVLPTALRGDAADLPKLAGPTAADLSRFRADWKEHDQREDLRLAYVAVTRAAHELVVTGYCWPYAHKRPFGPSPYLLQVRDLLGEWGAPVPSWCDKPDKGVENPLGQAARTGSYPSSSPGAEVARRREGADRVRAAMSELGSEDGAATGSEGGSATLALGLEPDLDLVAQSVVAGWDEDMTRLLDEARASRADVVEVPLPSSLSATSLARLRDDPDALAASLARPMPRPPSPSARFGTRFHAWVEARFGQQLLVDPDDLPGRIDAGIDDEQDLRTLIRAFEQGPFADRSPVAVEPAFALVLAGQVVRGRIDAVYRDGDGYLLVDWKTGRAATSDPIQLAIYRVAWAELHGVPLERVRACFYYVRTGVLDEPTELPGRGELERLVSG
ncbi:MAG TPA: UvrD-helicase domain-containing protein [Nocardioidaceae bacterium]|nr:UvrD-helicase domain-containing protein [Nocardioidaceae bacterium]